MRFLFLISVGFALVLLGDSINASASLYSLWWSIGISPESLARSSQFIGLAAVLLGCAWWLKRSSDSYVA